ncbi:fluoride efflux transporter CrcB [Candidatus Marinamargulisbacteria bacterium SCGC AG-414-C22]|nr:fluoride efflux transporter CrcB [Candidatus Marinamargulisbacteria bacterium SCGC AG-414-C22]
MKALLSVCIGASIGASFRYAIGIMFKQAAFPVATIIVNIVGCFLMGLCLSLLDYYNVSAGIKVVLITGFLGSFTTFSAFGYDVYQLYQQHDLKIALGYVLVMNVGGVMCLLLGLSCSKLFR